MPDQRTAVVGRGTDGEAGAASSRGHGRSFENFPENNELVAEDRDAQNLAAGPGELTFA
ncbi:hypothetical protein CHELA20_51037 [Hyphomicrobiales bacterium]|nr:hypothetical protein CHELA20_51037 [Hyphomicrobiales bacterium]CAH1674505.1 hypothetical protein CHELA41_23975 [Hyphomicrobiales bacterium]